MSTAEDAIGPIIVWSNYGYDGWHPRSYASVKDALLGERYGSDFIITRRVEFDVLDKTDIAP